MLPQQPQNPSRPWRRLPPFTLRSPPRWFKPAILNMAVFAENFQKYRRKIEPKDSETSKTHCKTKLFARR